MKSILIRTSFILFCHCGFSQSDSILNRHAIYVEAFGPGIYYSVGYAFNHVDEGRTGIGLTAGFSLFPNKEGVEEELGLSLPISFIYKIKLHRRNLLNLGLGSTVTNYYSSWNSKLFYNAHIGFEHPYKNIPASIQAYFYNLLIPYRNSQSEKLDGIKYWPWAGVRFSWYLR